MIGDRTTIGLKAEREGEMRTITMTVAALLPIVMAAGSSGVAAAGHTASQMEQAGYFCFNAGPANWTHCLNPGLLGNPAVSVKVFSEDGSEFLGTEQLMRYDIYSGQPCPQDDLNQWDFLVEPPYFACHHFHTGHH